MSVRQFFELVKPVLLTYRPSVTFHFGSESRLLQNEPERVCWTHVEDDYTRELQRGSRLSPAGTTGAIWSRQPMCMLYFWVPGVIDSDGNEYPNDNADPSRGTVWLPAVLIHCVESLAAHNYNLGKGRFLERSEGNLGFVYTLELMMKTPIYGLTSGSVATIQTYTQTAEVG